MEHMADGLKENYDEEVCAKDNLARQLNKALGDADMWKQKYEIDGIAKAEELEMAKVDMSPTNYTTRPEEITHETSNISFCVISS